MANGDYWNKGRRREGFQQSSSLDTLERLLGIGSNIAGKVQANRYKMEAYNLNYINSLTQGLSSNFKMMALVELMKFLKS